MLKRIFIELISLFNYLFRFIGLLSYFLYPPFICGYVDLFLNSFYSGRIARRFAKCGNNLYVKRKITLWQPRQIFIGNNVEIHRNAILATHLSFAELVIGDGVVVGENCHITCVSKIIIEDGVLMGKKCIITDNSHGKIDFTSTQIPPNKRNIISGGNVFIGRNVWLGDNVVVLPGVTIGEGCVIGASTVVTKSIPAYSVCVGNPARIIKSLQ